MKEAYLILLKNMVATPSFTYQEEKVRDLIKSFLEGRGIACALVRNNILSINRHWSAKKPTVMLCAHMDTVEPCGGYAFDPFLPAYEKVADAIGHSGGFVAGLGSNDDGASVVTMIAAYSELYDRKDLPYNLLLAITTEEERSGDGGARYLWNEYWEQLPGEYSVGNYFPRPSYAIIGEPTGGRAATSERGLLVLDGLAQGVSGHAARNEGVNALYIALKDIERLRNFDFERISPTMGKVKLTVTQIQAGSAHNVVPDKCTFVVDIRPTEAYTNTEILEMLQGICRSKLSARNLANCSSATEPEGVMMKAVLKTGLETFSSPTTSDWMRTKCDAIKLGPGESSRSHHANEYVLESEMDNVLEKYLKLLTNISL